MREKLIAEYHDLLEADETLTTDFFAHLKRMMAAERLLYGDREIGIALRPHLLTRSQFNQLAKSAEILAGAFDKLAAAMLVDPSRMKMVGLTDREIQLSLIDPGYNSFAATTRLDAFVHANEVKFVEFNAENPSSLHDQARLNCVLQEVGAMRILAERYKLQQFRPFESLLKLLREIFREWGGAGEPNIAIVDWEGLPTAKEFVLLQEFFIANGVQTVICAPDQLEYENGRLRFGDSLIDLVYKRVIIHELLEHCGDSHPLIRAYAGGDVCLVNSFRCKMVHKKAAFDLLTDETRSSWLGSAEREVVRHCVPWTRRVKERKTLYLGREIDLIEYVRKHRALFVLKPNDDYGGRDIHFGDHASESEWDHHLTEALAGDYVVQEKLKLAPEVFPIFTDNGWTFQPMFVDTNPFLFRGRVEGAMVRLSDSPVVNVTSGGGETGFFVIEDQ